MNSVEIPLPDDWHVHLREGELLQAVIAHTAAHFRYAMVMPNLRPPITTAALAVQYRETILACVGDQYEHFRPQFALFMSDALTRDDLAHGLESGAIAAVKYYPAGATTNSDQSRGTLLDYLDQLEMMAELGVRLLVHAESTDPAVDIFDREAAFLQTELAEVCVRIPELKLTVEHVSTAAGVEFVAAHPNVVATITPHHLWCERSDLLASGMKPDLYCKPIINSARDRAALVAAATSGPSKFLFGSDSAPHPTRSKYGPSAAAGIFNAPFGIQVVAEVFFQANRLDALGDFVSHNGVRAYGVEPCTQMVRLVRTQAPEPSPDEPVVHLADGDSIVMFGSQVAASWRLEHLST